MTILLTILIAAYVIGGAIWGGFSAGVTFKRRGWVVFSFMFNFATWPLWTLALLGYLAFKFSQPDDRIDPSTLNQIRDMTDSLRANRAAARNKN